MRLVSFDLSVKLGRSVQFVSYVIPFDILFVKQARKTMSTAVRPALTNTVAKMAL